MQKMLSKIVATVMLGAAVITPTTDLTYAQKAGDGERLARDLLKAAAAHNREVLKDTARRGREKAARERTIREIEKSSDGTKSDMDGSGACKQC